MSLDYANMSDEEIVSFVALRRTVLPTDIWRGYPIPAIKSSLRLSEEFHEMNAAAPTIVCREITDLTQYSLDLIVRAYDLLLSRSLTKAEVAAWSASGTISLSQLTFETFFSAEALAHDGLNQQQLVSSSQHEDVLQLQRIVNTLNFDLFSRFRGHRTQSRNKLDIQKSVRIGLLFFHLTMDDLAYAQAAIANICKLENVLLTIVTVDQIISGSKEKDIDLFICNNNNLYDRQNELLKAIHAAPYYSCCWLWDNHHQFSLSQAVIGHFDLCLPAHSNGQTYLHSGRAKIGTLTPCCTFQFSRSEASTFFEQYGRGNRNDLLFGSFNSYSGRLSARDWFIRKIMDSDIPNSLRLIPSSENNWYQIPLEDRFRELATHKVVLCSPIANDVPARVFDALLAGAIPLVPMGLPDLTQCFSKEELRQLPVGTFVEGDLDSLRDAIAENLRRFDALGGEGAAVRHEVVHSRHMMSTRLTEIAVEAVGIGCR